MTDEKLVQVGLNGKDSLKMVLKEENVDLVILQSRITSCGVNTIYIWKYWTLSMHILSIALSVNITEKLIAKEIYEKRF